MVKDIFQANIGRLEWEGYKLGDLVFGTAPKTKRGPIGPLPGLENTDLWANAIGDCIHCKSDIYARIEIRAKRFDKLAVVQAPDPTKAFDLLKEWGFLAD